MTPEQAMYMSPEMVNYMAGMSNQQMPPVTQNTGGSNILPMAGMAAGGAGAYFLPKWVDASALKRANEIIAQNPGLKPFQDALASDASWKGFVEGTAKNRNAINVTKGLTRELSPAQKALFKKGIFASPGAEIVAGNLRDPLWKNKILTTRANERFIQDAAKTSRTRALANAALNTSGEAGRYATLRKYTKWGPIALAGMAFLMWFLRRRANQQNAQMMAQNYGQPETFVPEAFAPSFQESPSLGSLSTTTPERVKKPKWGSQDWMIQREFPNLTYEEIVRMSPAKKSLMSLDKSMKQLMMMGPYPGMMG